MKQFLYIILFCAMPLSLYTNEYCLSAEHNMPRNDDKVNYQIIDYINFNDSTNIWDFSSTNVSDIILTNHFLLSGDTLISRFDGEIMTSRIINDSVLCYKTASQGKLLNFHKAELVKSFPSLDNSNLSNYFYSEGTIDHSRYIRQAGTSSTSTKKGRLITPDGDFFPNVILVKNIRIGSTIINNDYRNSFLVLNDSSMLSPDSISWHLQNDSITFCQETNRWYARGYRYPIMESRKVISFFYDIPTDSIFTAYYCSPHYQEHELATDPVNETLRNDDESFAFNRSFGISNDTKSTKKRGKSLSDIKNTSKSDASTSSHNESCQINNSEISGTLNVNYTTQSESIVAVTLHNSAGALMWHTNKVAVDSQGEITYPTHELVAGEYLVTVFLKNSQYTFKFIKK